jgi:hypothetical protein
MRSQLLFFFVISAFIASVAGMRTASNRPTADQREPETSTHPLERRYSEGEQLRYLMQGFNGDRRYEAQATGVVKKDPSGRFFEEFAWSNLVLNGTRLALSPESLAYRQAVSLDPGYKQPIPNLTELDPSLTGPVLDLLNFYVDLQLAMKQPELVREGSRVVVPRATPNSWADGKRVLVGEDAIDFEITLETLDAAAGVATVVVAHVPPPQPRVQFPAPWMRAPVGDTPNNWVQVAKSDKGYEASVGKETFEVRMMVNFESGKIIWAEMDNTVQVLERSCADAALMNCGAPARRQIKRHIELSAVPVRTERVPD